MKNSLLVCLAPLALACSDDAGKATADAGSPPGRVDAGPLDPDAAPGGPDAGPDPLGEPFWQSDMTAGGDDFYVRKQPDGVVERGVADPGADDGFVARLVFAGNPALGNADRTTPDFASELGTNRDDFHYGTYKMRVKLARCAPGEEVVNGLFTYFNDGTDHDDDGVNDNSEIDIEVLCGAPDALFLTVWTDYTFSNETFRKWTYVVDFATGDLWESTAADQYGIDKVGNDPTLKLPGFLSPDHFIELGWEWRADKVRYFATIDGAERTLFTLTDAALVPKLPTALLFNVWHSADHWFGPMVSQPPDHPAQDATLLVDWVRYWK
jgi:hypothetical protein